MSLRLETNINNDFTDLFITFHMESIQWDFFKTASFELSDTTSDKSVEELKKKKLPSF